MKLSHLSLAVLSAIALAACGGSNNDQTTPEKPHTNSDANGGAVAPDATTPTTPEVKDPNASVPVTNDKNATFIDPASAENTAAAKKIYFGRASRDTVIGYLAGNSSSVYAGAGTTDRPDIMRADSITTNYLNSGLASDKTNLVSPGVNGLMFNPVQTYVQGSDGIFYRVRSPNNVTPGVLDRWDAITRNNVSGFRFTVVGQGVGGALPANVTFGNNRSGNNDIPATELVYIPNAASGARDATQTAAGFFDPTAELTPGLALSGTEAGANQIDLATNPLASFALKENEVVPTILHFSGKDYAYATLSPNIEIDLGLEPAQEIVKLPITVDYNIIDDKHTDNVADDDFIQQTVQSGEAMVYNLNYSRAMVQVNDAARVNQSSPIARVRNVLNQRGNHLAQPVGGNGYYGAFQVVGRQTGTLPNNGRAVYTGKSFGLDRVGDIKLEADFGKDRASISGSVFNRKDSQNNALPTITLQQIMLSQPSSYEETASRGMGGTRAQDGNVLSADPSVNNGTWAVSLFGANAENAGGVIFDAAVGGNHNVVEAFNSARGDITPKSLNN